MSNTQWPNLFIVGAAKAGTTSLYKYLEHHPDICMASVKEPHYFADINPKPELAFLTKIIKDQTAYLNLFNNPTARYRGEASPSYLWDESVAAKLKQASPEAKIIIMLREPVSRAYSHYLMDVREGIQHLPFTEALKQDYAQPNKGWDVSRLYVELGFYCQQLQAYQNEFKREQLKIVFFEEFIKDVPAGVNDILQFLELESDGLDELELSASHNAYAEARSELARRLMGAAKLRGALQRVLPKSVKSFLRHSVLTRQAKKPEIPAEARAFLASVYQQERVCLEALVGRALPWGEDA